jgi:hypothetical protein
VIMLSYREANNHPLNTWAMFVCSKLFGNSEISLRLPNILAHIMYLLSSILFIRRIKKPLLMIASFSLLNMNVLLLDFFSLARGYGLALAFLMCSAWLFLECLYAESEKKSLVYGYFSLILITLSAFANFTFLLPLIAFHLVLVMLVIYKRKTASENTWSDTLKTSTITSFIIFVFWNFVFISFFVGAQMIDLKLRKALYAGGATSLWHDTVESLLTYSYGSLYRVPWAPVHLNFPILIILIKIFIVLVSCFGLMMLIKSVQKIDFKNKLIPYAAIASILFVVTVVANILHYLFKMNFSMDRTAIQFIPLFALLAIFSLIRLEAFNTKPTQYVVKMFSLAIIFVMILNLSTSANLFQTEWPRDADTRMVMDDLNRIYHEDFHGEKISLGVSWLLEPSINFYRMTRKMSWLEEVDRMGLEKKCDLYFIIPSDMEKINKFNNMQIIKTYPRTGNSLIQIKKALK